MKINKSYIGKECRIKWRDPYTFTVESKYEFDEMRGWKSLPVWTERGIIDDITDDVVRIINKHVDGSVTPSWSGSVMPAALIEEVQLLDAKSSILQDTGGTQDPPRLEGQ